MKVEDMKQGSYYQVGERSGQFIGMVGKAILMRDGEKEFAANPNDCITRIKETTATNTETHRICEVCGEEKNLEDFRRVRGGARTKTCSACIKSKAERRETTATERDAEDSKSNRTKDAPVDIDGYRDAWQEIMETKVKKNKDYGNSFAESLDEYGPVAGVIQIGHKFNRAKQLAKVGQAKVNESLSDTLKDMANYCLMMAGWLAEKEAGQRG